MPEHPLLGWKFVHQCLEENLRPRSLEAIRVAKMMAIRLEIKYSLRPNVSNLAIRISGYYLSLVRTFTCKGWWGRRFKEYRFSIRALE